MERGDDTEVPAAAPQPQEQVRVLLLGCDHLAPVGRVLRDIMDA